MITSLVFKHKTGETFFPPYNVSRWTAKKRYSNCYTLGKVVAGKYFIRPSGNIYTIKEWEREINITD